jgi:hypothetical protein
LAGNRDDFTDATKNKLGKQVSWNCSRPGCVAPTTAATADGNGVIMIGRAAHITAAASGGPRYDFRLTPAERKSVNNGIWLCATCANLIDADESAFSEEQIREWKRTAQKRARLELVLSHARSGPGAPFGAEEIADALALVTHAAQTRLETLRRIATWPRHPIPLDLRLVEDKASHSLQAESLAAVLDTVDDAAVVAAPGAGKTTTMLQIASAIIERRDSVAAVVLLAEWAVGGDSLLLYLSRQAGFRDVPLAQIELLAKSGRLVLLLDGWNELDESSRRRTRLQINELKREYPELQFVVSSRHQEHDFPVSGPVVTLGALSHRQQSEIATALRGADGHSLLEHAWRTSGLRELIEIPLYLTVLLDQTPGARLPTTKDELLRAFAQKHESNPDHAPALRAELHELHPKFLTAVARAAMESRSTALSAEAARTTIVDEQTALIARHQLSAAIPAPRVLDILARAHLITRHAGGSVGFHHHQFQEWYASHWVEELLLSSYEGNIGDHKTLREDVLDVPDWEEAVLFACERLSHKDRHGAEAVAASIVHTFGIDPVFAAEMIFRSSEETWTVLGAEAQAFARAWMRRAPRGKATDFMVASGKAEFAEDLWPLIANPHDDRSCFEVLRAGPRFRTSVLGPDPGRRIQGLTEVHRARIISEVAFNGGMDGLELAARLATSDDSVKVKTEAAEAIAFRHASGLLASLLADSPQTVWDHLASKWTPDEFDDPTIADRIRAESARLAERDERPEFRLHQLMRSPEAPEKEEAVERLIGEIDFATGDGPGRTSVHDAFEKYPAAVARGLVRHIDAATRIPYGGEDLLRDSGITLDDGPVIEQLLAEPGNEVTAKAITVAGPRSLGVLIDRLLAVDRELAAQREARRAGATNDRALGEQHLQLSGLLSQSRFDLLAEAMLERAGTREPVVIKTFSDLLSRYGRDMEQRPLRASPALIERLKAALISWSGTLLADRASTRDQLATLAQAMTRLPSDGLLVALTGLLNEDLARLAALQEEASNARQERRPIPDDVRMRWNTQFARAFMAIGTERVAQLMMSYLEHPEFGLDAAQTLAHIARGPEPRDDNKPFKPSPDFEPVRENYRKRQNGEFLETHAFVDPILAAARNLASSGEARSVERGLNLAAIALGMPYANKREEIDWFLRLDVPAIQQQRLLTFMALAGELVPFDLVTRGIDQLIADGQTHRWMLEEQEGWRLDAWLKLLPFTGNPEAVFPYFDRLDARYLTANRMRGFMAALGFSPFQKAEQVLVELARRDPRLLSDYQWITAVGKRRTESMGQLLLDVLEAGIDARANGRRLDIYRLLAGLLERHPGLRAAVHARYRASTPGLLRSILEMTIAEDASEDGVIALLDINASEERPLQSTALPSALQNALVGNQPSSSFRGMREMYGLPAADLRRRLFDVVLTGSPAAASLATACLDEIDEIRDRYGSAASDRRHPNIQAGRPWPARR